MLASALRGDPRFTRRARVFASAGYCLVVAAAPGLAADDLEKTAHLALANDATNVGIQLAVLACATALGAASADRGRILRRSRTATR